MLVKFAFPFADVGVYILYVYNRICKCGNMESILKSFWPACHNSSANRWVPCFHVLPLNLQRLRKLFFVRPTAQLHAKRPNLRENKCIDQAWNQEHPEMCPPKLLHVPSHGSGRSIFIQRMSSCLPGDKSMAGKSSFLTKQYNFRKCKIDLPRCGNRLEMWGKWENMGITVAAIWRDGRSYFTEPKIQILNSSSLHCFFWGQTNYCSGKDS